MIRWRYILPVGGLIAGGVVYAYIHHSPPPKRPQPQTEHHDHTAEKARAVPPPQSLPDMSTPVQFEAPSLGITAPIEKVGLTTSGDMTVPVSETSLGWYTGGAFPGNAGPSVLAGHTGVPDKPSPFRKLASLQKGDVVHVIDTAGNRASFQVIETASYTPDTAPRQRIFGATTSSRLTIITCSGAWIPAKNTYSHRLVIYSVRTNEVYTKG